MTDTLICLPDAFIRQLSARIKEMFIRFQSVNRNKVLIDIPAYLKKAFKAIDSTLFAKQVYLIPIVQNRFRMIAQIEYVYQLRPESTVVLEVHRIHSTAVAVDTD